MHAHGEGLASGRGAGDIPTSNHRQRFDQLLSSRERQAQGHYKASFVGVLTGTFFIAKF